MKQRRIGMTTLMAGICIVVLLTGCNPSEAASATEAPTTETLSQSKGIENSAVRDDESAARIAPEEPVIGMANPASVNCREQGGRLDHRTDDDGNQYGVCQFKNGTECEEWTLFRGECSPATAGKTTRLIYGWHGTIVTPPVDQPFNAYLTLSPQDSGSAGLVPMNAEVQNIIAKLKDSERLAHIWGALVCPSSQTAPCRVEAMRIVPEGPAEPVAPTTVERWEGTLRSLPPMAQFDDVFVLNNERFPVHYGIEAANAAVDVEMARLRDSGIAFRINGELTCPVIDVNGCQITVTQIEREW